MQTELKQAFNAFDIEQKGYLTPETVGLILGCFDNTITQSRLEEIIAEVDEDGMGNEQKSKKKI